MELKNIISRFATKKGQQETFFALEIAQETVKSAVWAVKEGKTVTLKLSSTEEWDGESEESFLQAVDKTISSAGEGLDPEPKAIIFGLPQEWTSGSQIIASKKLLLKSLCEKLALKPLGFVVTLEALLEYLKKEEGVPVNAIFVGLEETQATIFWVEFGRIKESQLVGRSEDLAADVNEGLNRFGKDKTFPARIIVFDGIVDFEEAKQQLISFDWQAELNFLHLPKIETLESNIAVKAVVVAGGAEIAKSLGFEIVEEETKELTKEKEETSSETPDEEQEQTESITGAEELGFKVGGDILDSKELPTVEPEQKVTKEELDNLRSVSPEIQITGRNLEKTKFSLNPLLIIRGIKRVLSSFRLFSFSFKNRKKKFMFLSLLLLFLGFLTILAFATFWYLPKAKILIFVSPKNLDKEIGVTLASESKIEDDSFFLKANEVQEEVNGNKSKETTGEKLIGDKATGEITIFNKTDTEKVFNKGAVLIGGDDLKFLLDEEVTVASKSSEATEEGENIVYGKQQVKVVAASIGAEYNLSAGSDFTFKEYPSSLYSAKTDEGLSGGMSRQIKAVDEKDMENLLAELTDELIEKGKQEIKSKISSSEQIIISEEIEVLEKKFSAQEGDEADKISLELKLKLTGFVYETKELSSLLKDIFAESIPEGYDFDNSQIDFEIIETSTKKNTVFLQTDAKIKLIPRLNIEQIRENLKGLKPVEAEAYLKTLPNFSKAEILLTPQKLLIRKNIPYNLKNINIEIKTD